MGSPAKRQRRKVGNFLAIPMPDGSYCFARERAYGIVAIYNLRSKTVTSPEQLRSTPIAFSIAVMDYAVKSGRWPIIGWAPLEPRLLFPLRFFIQDKISGRFSVYHENGTIVPASRAEVEGLEPAAAWDPEHVEDRLRDHFAGAKNIWLESMRPK